MDRPNTVVRVIIREAWTMHHNCFFVGKFWHVRNLLPQSIRLRRDVSVIKDLGLAGWAASWLKWVWDVCNNRQWRTLDYKIQIYILLVYRNYPSRHYCHRRSNEESSEGMWARSVKTLIERNIRHWANMPTFNDVLEWGERQTLLSCCPLISQTRMMKAQGNWHKRNMQRFKVKQCIDARESKPFGILKNMFSPWASLWAWCWG